MLRVFLPTCNEKELASLFGPVMSYLLEDEDPGLMLRFRLQDGLLKEEKKPLSAG